MEFRLLGPVEAWHDGAPMALGRRRERCLLGILLLDAGAVVPTRRLVDLLWGDDPPPTARADVHTHVSRLRHRLDPANDGAWGMRIVGRSGGYVAEVGHDRVDVHRFRALVAEARAAQARDVSVRSARLGEALALWRGPLLADVADDRLRDRIGGDLAEERMLVTELAVATDLEAGRAGEAVTRLTVLVQEFPLREGLRALLMLALYRCGRAGDALDAFRDARAVLVGELGIEPGPELQQMHRRILDRDPQLSLVEPAPPRNDLPRDVADFTGRGAELDRLLDLLPGRRGGGEEATAVVISAIDGMAGIGKTTLAVHAAHRLAEGRRDAALFVDLRAHTAGQEPVDPALALDRLLRAVGVAVDRIPDGLDERSALWRAELATRRVVLVLDNAASAAQVRPLLPGTPASLTLITSRQRLSDLEATRQISLDVLSASEGAVLFGRVVGDGRPAAESEQVAAVVRLCGHLPLAIRIAGARLRNRPSWTVAYLAERLADGAHRLAELEVGDSRLAAAFAVSYERLDSDQQRLFRLLGLISVPDFDAYFAAALGGADPTTARRILEELVDANLLQSSAPHRYRFHDLLREYAAALAESDESAAQRQVVTGRALDYYLSATAAAMALLEWSNDPLRIDLTGPAPAAAPVADADAARSFVDDEHANLVTVIGVAAARGCHTHAWQLAHLLQYHFNLGAHFNDWLSTHEIAVASTRALGDRHAEAHMLRKLGLGYHTLARYGDAIDRYDRALELYRATGDRNGEGVTLNNLGTAWERLDRYDEALRHYEQSLTLRRATGNRGGEGATLQNIGVVFAYLGRYPEALDHYQQALALARQVGNQRAVAISLNNIGEIEESLGDYDAARRHQEEALKLHEAMGNQPFIAAVLTNLGNIGRRQSRHAESIDQHRRALDVARSSGHRALECEVLNNLGQTYGASGETVQALDVHERALELATQLGSGRQRARAHHGIAQALAAADPPAAHDHARAALAIFEDLQLPDAEPVRELLRCLDTDA
jgi:DNA-binding SARP family transcriptional activator/tetratricopeptide (TPR) repeat protein